MRPHRAGRQRPKNSGNAGRGYGAKAAAPADVSGNHATDGASPPSPNGGGGGGGFGYTAASDPNAGFGGFGGRRL